MLAIPITVFTNYINSPPVFLTSTGTFISNQTNHEET